MPPPFPASLKPIHPFLNKAEEMKTADPVVAYYCNYWAVQYAISLGIRDPETNVFLASLLDTLEKTKKSMLDSEAITDDIVGKAYMENFAGNIFTKADDEERTKKATRATATKFLAAAQFMEVLRCFGDLDKETSDKIRYAKFQCARILKALKAGEDPNAGSPVVEDPPAPVVPYVSPSKESPPIIPEPKDENALPPPQPMTRNLSAQSQQSASSARPMISAPHSPNEFQPPPPNPQNNDRPQHSFSPLPPTSFSPPPSSPQPPQQQSPPPNYPPSLPVNPYTSNPKPPLPPPQLPQQPPPTIPPYPQVQPSSNYYTSQQQQQPPAIPPPQTSNYYSSQPQSAPFQPQPSPSYFPPQPQVVLDDEAIAKAQKHARWAISALNYEDFDTAIKELKEALGTLGVK